MIIGIDIGYYQTKWDREGGRKASFLSVSGTPDLPRFSIGGSSGRIVEVPSDGIWLVGGEAVEQSRFETKREDRAWIRSKLYYRLFLAALAEATDETDVDVQIVTGLPLAYYSDNEVQRQLFLGEHRVRLGDRDYWQQFNVTDCVSLPQPLGTVFSEILDDDGQFVNEEYMDLLGCIDVGGKTTNVQAVNRPDPETLHEIARETFFIDVGGWDLTRRIQVYLAKRCPDLDLRDHEIAKAIIQGWVRYHGKKVDITDTVNTMSSDLIDQIVGGATSAWGSGAQLTTVLVTGGGALLMGPRIAAQFRQARVVERPITANAEGYRRYGRRLWG